MAVMAWPYRVVLFAVATLAVLALVVWTARALVVLFGGVLFAVALRALGGALSRRPRLPCSICSGALVLAIVAGAVAMVVFPPVLTLAGQIIFATSIGPIGLVFSTPLLVVGVSTMKSIRSQVRAPRP